jgi:hypothetical protein
VTIDVIINIDVCSIFSVDVCSAVFVGVDLYSIDITYVYSAVNMDGDDAVK